MLNTIEIKQKPSIDNNNNTASVNLNLNDINLGFVDPQNFTNAYWSTTGLAASTSSFPSSTSYNIGILQQQQQQNGNQLYEHTKSDNAILVVSNGGQNPYYLSQ